MNKTHVMAAAAGLMLLAGGCGGGSDSTDQAAADCLPVETATLDLIADRSEPAITPVAGEAVRHPDFEQVYMVAMTFSAEGVEDQTGVWALTDLVDPSGILAVDGMAQQFTDWIDADTTDAAIGVADAYVDTAKACL